MSPSDQGGGIVSDNPPSRKLSAPIEAALGVLIRTARDAGAYGDLCDRKVDAALDEVRATVAAGWPAWPYGQPMSTAPRDGFAFLATGTHIVDDPSGAARGVKAGDRWWSILLFDIWREPDRFVFAKDGAPPWSEPELWCPLPDLLAGDPAPHVLPAEMTPSIAEALGQPNFVCGPLADVYRAAGAVIKRRSEPEQAFVLFRHLRLALRHGEAWREAVSRELEEALAVAGENLPSEAQP